MPDSPAVILYDSSGNPVGVVLDGSIYRLQVEAKISENIVKQLFDIQTTVIYVGTAPLGSESDSAVWKIKKTTLDETGNPTVAEWSEDDVIWDDRASLTYT